MYNCKQIFLLNFNKMVAILRFRICIILATVSLLSALECPYFDTVSNQNKTLNNTCDMSHWLHWDCSSCYNGNSNQTVVRYKVVCCPIKNITACRDKCNTTEADDTDYGICTHSCPNISTVVLSNTYNNSTSVSTAAKRLATSSLRTLNISETKTAILLRTRTTSTPGTSTSTRSSTIYEAVSSGISNKFNSAANTKPLTTSSVGTSKTPNLVNISSTHGIPTYGGTSSGISNSLNNAGINISSLKPLTTPSSGTSRTSTPVTLPSTHRTPQHEANSSFMSNSFKTAARNMSSSIPQTTPLLRTTKISTSLALPSTHKTSSYGPNVSGVSNSLKTAAQYNSSLKPPGMTSLYIGSIKTSTPVTLPSSRKTFSYGVNSSGVLTSLKTIVQNISSPKPLTTPSLLNGSIKKSTPATLPNTHMTATNGAKSSEISNSLYAATQNISSSKPPLTTPLLRTTKTSAQMTLPSIHSTPTHGTNSIEVSISLKTAAQNMSRSKPQTTTVAAIPGSLETLAPRFIETTTSKHAAFTKASRSSYYDVTKESFNSNSTLGNIIDNHGDGLNDTVSFTVRIDEIVITTNSNERAGESDHTGLSSTAVAAIAGCISAVALASIILGAILIVKRIKRRVEPFGQDSEVNETLY